MASEDGLGIAVFVGEKDEYSIHLSSQFQLIVSDADPSDRDYGEDKLTGIEVVAFNEEYFAMSDLRLEALLNSPASVSKNVNRSFNSHTGKHLFSANQLEIDYLVRGGNGWSNEGISYSTPELPTAEIYRFLVAGENRHFTPRIKPSEMMSLLNFRILFMRGLRTMLTALTTIHRMRSRSFDILTR